MKKQNKTARIREIVRVFMKYGVWDAVRNMSSPEKIRMALEELGPSFIKIGQILSTRPDILPASYIEEFQKLHDDVKPEKSDIILEIVEKELGGPVSARFRYFDIKPVACASMAVVHLAELHNGDRVAVKVQRPRARETILIDLAIIKKMSVLLKLAPRGSTLNLAEVLDELMSVVINELNFLNEAKNIKAFSENNMDIRYITCPKVYDAYTTENILVMQYIEGIKIADVSRLNQGGYDLYEIVAKLAGNYFKQILEDGFFHADPHPGNIIITGNKISFIDFGMMGTLNKSYRSMLSTFLYGVATKNVDILCQTISRIGIHKGNTDYSRLYSDVEQIYNSYIGISLQDINLLRMISEVFKACRKNNLAIPRDITMFLKGIMTFEGVVAQITPEINIMDIAIPYVRLQMLKEWDFRQEAVEQVNNLLLLLKQGPRIPVKLLELLDNAASGKLKVKTEIINAEIIVSELHKMMNRLILGIIITAVIIGSSQVVKAEVGLKILNLSAIGFIGYIFTLVLGVWLFISIARSGKIW